MCGVAPNSTPPPLFDAAQHAPEYLTGEYIGGPVEHVVVYDVYLPRTRRRLWMYCFFDLGGYGLSRVKWTTPAGSPADEVPAPDDEPYDLAGSRKVTEYDTAFIPPAAQLG